MIDASEVKNVFHNHGIRDAGVWDSSNLTQTTSATTFPHYT